MNNSNNPLATQLAVRIANLEIENAQLNVTIQELQQELKKKGTSKK